MNTAITVLLAQHETGRTRLLWTSFLEDDMTAQSVFSSTDLDLPASFPERDKYYINSRGFCLKKVENKEFLMQVAFTVTKTITVWWVTPLHNIPAKWLATQCLNFPTVGNS